MIDVGTGAGFPGLPLKIVLPWMQVTLVEATGKKAEFCRHVVDGLGLESGHRGPRPGGGRRTDAGAPAGLPLGGGAGRGAAAGAGGVPAAAGSKLGGRAIAQKGETGPAEAHAADGGLRLLGGRVQQLIPVELPRIPETRYLVVLEKTAATPDEYPRRAGQPARRPWTEPRGRPLPLG